MCSVVIYLPVTSAEHVSVGAEYVGVVIVLRCVHKYILCKHVCVLTVIKILSIYSVIV